MELPQPLSSRLYSLKQPPAVSVPLRTLRIWRNTEPEIAQVHSLPLSRNTTFSAAIRTALLCTGLHASRQGRLGPREVRGKQQPRSADAAPEPGLAQSTSSQARQCTAAAAGAAPSQQAPRSGEDAGCSSQRPAQPTAHLPHVRLKEWASGSHAWGKTTADSLPRGLPAPGWERRGAPRQQRKGGGGGEDRQPPPCAPTRE